MPWVAWKKRSGFVVCLLALPLSLAAQAASNGAAASIANALRNRDFDSALQMITPALRQSPANPQLLMFQGLAYSGKGDQKAALGSYKQALKIAPDYLPALEGAAQIEYQSASKDAVPHLEQILRLRPGDPTTHAMLAVMAFRNSNCAVAVDHFAQSRAILDTQPGAMQDYGICLLRLKRPGEAIEIFQQLLASHPGDSRARQTLAATQLDASRPQDALATLQPLLDAGPDVDTMELAADIYEANKDTPHAAKILHDAIVRDPGNTALYVDFAGMALDHESFQAGVEMIDAGLRLQPQAAELYLARGVLYVQLARYDKAETDFEKADQLDPEHSLGAAAQGMVAEERDENDPDRALTAVHAKLVRAPQNAFLWYLQAAILSQKAPDPDSAEFRKGIDSAKKAVALDPTLTATHNVLAKFYLDSGDYALAIKECKLVLRKTPEDQTALYHLMVALRKTNQTAAIPEVLKKLAQARRDATKAEGERNRYKLIVADPAAQSPH
jgi:tetratricopeptide (TPR) repeat protein